MILNNYEEWRHCIEVKCGIALTPAFVKKRIAELSDANNHNTREFIALYGEDYKNKIQEWFEQASCKPVSQP